MNFEKYKNPLPYPHLDGKCPKCRAKYNGNDKFCSQCAENLLTHKEKHKNAIEEYNKKDRELNEQFVNDALTEVGLNDHPKKHAIYYYAYEHGHAYGYPEIFNVLQGLSELFK